MAIETTVTWRDEMTFDAKLGGHEITMDVGTKFGGRDLGPSPKSLLLPALAGCTGMDVVSMLKKMRVELSCFTLDVRAEVTDDNPKVFKLIHIVYNFSGKDLDRSEIERAVELSQKTYCGVSAMLGKTAEISYEINISD
ncbi:MAG: osmotically inducible protein OsmC [Deltaproteobacteria bacterium RIFOXYB12_FULL_58_9]|nr:MAG: osmotically inducible protein OsmC [Deltaproteobacteria bacterium RIFOXYB12_FULL_58_9]